MCRRYVNVLLACKIDGGFHVLCSAPTAAPATCSVEV